MKIEEKDDAQKEEEKIQPINFNELFLKKSSSQMSN